ncbi:MAG TPA: LptF/LptG family permease, partial [Opitutaceae bacterium]|nr:LptF/LptG family permease [Opitutaceae bacterium]
MRLLDRHIFRSALVTCLAAVAVFTFVVMTANLVRDLASPEAMGKFSWLQIGRFVLLLAPIGVSYGLPLGMLTGVLLTLSRLSADNEITGMRAAGISLKRIAAPILVLGAIGAAIELPVNFGSMPRARVEYEREFSEAVRANPLNFIVPRTFVRMFTNAVIYVGGRSGHNLSDIWAWKLDDQKRVRTLVHAKSGTIDYDPKAFELILTAKDGQEETLDDANPESFKDARPTVATVENWDPDHLSLQGIFARSSARQKLPWMTYRELRRERARRAALPDLTPRDRARSLMQVTLTVMDKCTMAFAVFTFAFVAVPLGIRVSRRETSASLVLGVVIGIAYYVLTIAIGLLD